MKTQEQPSGRFKSKLGLLTFQMTNASHVCIGTTKTGATYDWHEVKGKQFAVFSAHLYLKHGTWNYSQSGGDRTAFLSTAKMGDKITEHQRKQIDEEIVAAWNLHMKNFPFLQGKAERYESYKKKESAMSNILGINSQIAILQGQLTEAVKDLEELI